MEENVLVELKIKWNICGHRPISCTLPLPLPVKEGELGEHETCAEPLDLQKAFDYLGVKKERKGGRKEKEKRGSNGEPETYVFLCCIFAL